MMDEVKAMVNIASTEEMQRGIEKHGLFPTLRDGFSIMQEEFEETLEEIPQAKEIFGTCWEAIKKDFGTDLILVFLDLLRKKMVNIASESIQTIAMIDKIVKSVDEQKPQEEEEKMKKTKAQEIEEYVNASVTHSENANEAMKKIKELMAEVDELQEDAKKELELAEKCNAYAKALYEEAVKENGKN